MTTASERALVGMIMREPDNLSRMLEYGVTPGHFEDPEAKEILLKILEAEAGARPFDGYSIGASMGPTWVRRAIALHEEAPIASNLSFFADDVLGTAWSRQMTTSLMGVLANVRGREPHQEIAPLKAQIAALVDDLGGFGGRKMSFDAPEVADLVVAAAEREAAFAKEGKSSGVTTGLRVLDRVTHGWRPSRLYFLAARTGVGKTTIAVNFALSAAAAGEATAFFTHEMTAPEIGRKAMSRLSGVDNDRIISGRMTDADYDRFSAAHRLYSALPLTVSELHVPTIERFTLELRRLKRTRNVRFVIVDYVQQLRCESGKYFSRQAELSHITSQLKTLVGELDIAMLCLAQLNRKTADDDQPALHHLKDSGSIEQDADAVMLLWQTDDAVPEHVLWVAKQRHGGEARIPLKVDLATNYFGDDDRKYDNGVRIPPSA